MKGPQRAGRLHGVLHELVVQATSRNYRYGRFWLHGLLVESLGDTPLVVDLLTDIPSVSRETPAGVFRTCALADFRRHLERVGVTRSRLRSATLALSRGDEVVAGPVHGNGSFFPGWNLELVASVTDDRGHVATKRAHLTAYSWRLVPMLPARPDPTTPRS